MNGSSNWTFGPDGTTASGMSFEATCETGGTILLTPMWSDEEGVTVEVTAVEVTLTRADIARLHGMAARMVNTAPPVLADKAKEGAV